MEREAKEKGQNVSKKALHKKNARLKKMLNQRYNDTKNAQEKKSSYAENVQKYMKMKPVE